jgi:small subunit ribosomal protein S19
MARKEFTYRGKTLEELKKMSVEDFAKICTARVRRSITRQAKTKPFVHIMKKIKKYLEAYKGGKQPKPIRTHWRDLVIFPNMIGVAFAVHNGKEFNQVNVNEKMLGHYLGEFALTRKKLTHGKAGIGATKSSTAIAARK